jgi:hypothetical protein
MIMLRLSLERTMRLLPLCHEDHGGAENRIANCELRIANCGLNLKKALEEVRLSTKPQFLSRRQTKDDRPVTPNSKLRTEFRIADCELRIAD